MLNIEKHEINNLLYVTLEIEKVGNGYNARNFKICNLTEALKVREFNKNNLCKVL